jgi:NTP pyrophosphatase (non-canonical NTP hydrolase)
VKIPKRVKKISRLEKKSLVERGLKLNEEAGELAAEILKLKGLKGSSKSKKEILFDLHLEAIDCLLMAMDILVHTKASEKRIEQIMNSQLDKWERGFKK